MTTASAALANLASIKARLNRALDDAGRAQGEVEIMAVAKTRPADEILALLEAGHRLFGENRVQEAAAKWPALREGFPDLRLHLIGPLQSNKAREAVALFDAIETVDREKIARALAEEMARQGRAPALFVQVNTGEEPQKAGVAPLEADAFIAFLAHDLGIRPRGLMCIPPADEGPAPHFALLEKIARRNGLSALSMGMSGDFEIAAQLGATHVRIGSELFGPRMK